MCHGANDEDDWSVLGDERFDVARDVGLKTRLNLRTARGQVVCYRVFDHLKKGKVNFVSCRINTIKRLLVPGYGRYQ